MKKAWFLVGIVLSISICAYAGPAPAGPIANRMARHYAKYVETETRGGRLEPLVVRIMDTQMRKAARMLKAKNHENEAANLLIGWANEKAGLFNFAHGLNLPFAEFWGLFNIGDHPTMVLSTWVANAYEVVEAFLGKATCIKSHLADIKTLNSATKITFSPRSFPMDAVPGSREIEYIRHFAGGMKNGNEPYDGTLPVLTYWASEIALLVGGVTAPLIMIVPPLAEKFMENTLAPKLGHLIYSKANGALTGVEEYEDWVPNL